MKEVVIVGGGYGGLRAIEYLAKEPEINITLIDKNPYHYLQTEAYGYIAGRFDLSQVAIDLHKFSEGFEKPIRFLNDEVVDIDMENEVVKCKKDEISYDYLVIAVGAQTNFFSFIEGLKEHTHGVKSLNRAFDLRQSFETRVYQKLKNKFIDREGDLNIAIGGAGLSGVEIAAEMSYVLKKLKKTLGVHAKEIHIYLIDAAPTILPGMDTYIINKTQKRLESLGVKIMTNAFIQEVSEREIKFKNEHILPYDYMIFTGGIKAVPLIELLPVEKNNQNQLKVSEYLNLLKYKNVYAVGDCVEMRDGNSKLLAPTAQMAEKSAEYVAEAIAKRIHGMEPETFHASVDGVFVALGGEYATGILFDKIKVNGYLAYLLKKAITRMYRLGLEMKVNAGYKRRAV